MAKKVIEKTQRLNKEQLAILAACIKNIFAFSLHVKVVNPVKGVVPFNLYPFQRSTLLEFMKNRFNIVLKFRQAGITELISMYCLWLAMFHPNKKIIIISIKDNVAKKVLKKIKFMYKNLPWFLQTPIINGRAGEMGSSTLMEFSNGSTIESIPTSEQAGRSEAVSLLVIDEAAMVRWAATIAASAIPTLSTGGQFIANSTPLGIGNWYHSQWVDAINDLNGFNPIRLYWNMHPERDDGWYNEMARALGPKRTAQEIDGDFLSSGNMVFEASDIKAIEEDLYEYPTIKKRLNGQFLQFLEPEKDMDYYIGADISTGRATDYSSFTCMDDSGEEYAVFKGKIPINKFSRLLGDIGEVFNYAKLAPETNDIGMATTMFLQDEGYPNLYHHRKFLKKKGSRKKEIELIPGWITTGKNRSMIIEGLEKDIREEEVIIKDPFFVQEAYTFIYDGQGRPVAMGKHKSKNSSVDIDLEGETYADDSIFGKAITNHIRKYSKIESTTVMPQ